MALQQHLKSRQKLLPTPFQFSTYNFKPMNSDQDIVATLLMMLHFQVCLVRTYVNLSKLSIFSKILERITVGGIISITISQLCSQQFSLGFLEKTKQNFFQPAFRLTNSTLKQIIPKESSNIEILCMFSKNSFRSNLAAPLEKIGIPFQHDSSVLSTFLFKKSFSLKRFDGINIRKSAITSLE